jgi:uncharacterized protein (TIGR03067 family)
MSCNLAVCLALLVPAAPLSEAAEKVLRVLQGKWEVVRLVAKDGAVDFEEGDRAILEFRGRKWIFDGEEKAEITVVDPSTDPICLDTKSLEKGGKGKEEEGVYKREGDTLRIAFYQGKGKQRPTGFDKPTDPDTLVITLKRVKGR